MLVHDSGTTTVSSSVPSVSCCHPAGRLVTVGAVGVGAATAVGAAATVVVAGATRTVVGAAGTVGTMVGVAAMVVVVAEASGVVK